jgi:hypothetical protein
MFQQIGPIKQFKIGVHKRIFQKEGYYFVEFYQMLHAEIAKFTFNKMIIDDCKIFVDFDLGF